MGNIVRNTIIGMIIAMIFNLIVWAIMNAANVTHSVTTQGGMDVGAMNVIIGTLVGSILAAIGYMIFRSFLDRTALLIVGAIVTILSLYSPLTSALDGGYGTYVSLGIMHIITFAALAYMLLSDRWSKETA